MARRRLFTFLTRRRAFRSACVLLVLGLAMPQLWAWYHLRSASAALAKHHPDEARAALASCERVWGGRASVHLLAARAARQAGDIPAAATELRTAQRLAGGGATDATAFEWALLQASAGNVREVEEFLQKRAEQNPTAAPLVWEAQAVGYLRAYRTVDAMACLNHWLKRQPDDVRALELRGETYVIGKGVTRGADDYRRVLELDPTRSATRWKLAECLLALGSYDEAATHLEQFSEAKPTDPVVASRLARCYHVLGRRPEARALIDAALRAHPNDAGCLRTRGQLTLTDPDRPRPAEAEADLRRAVELRPEDYLAQNLLFSALQQQGKVEEAKAQLAISESVRDRAERFGELSSRKLAESPLDPELHFQMGKLLMQTGRPDVGVQWLLTALALDPDHKASHLELAAYYERTGDKPRAEEHRAAAAKK